MYGNAVKSNYRTKLNSFFFFKFSNKYFRKWGNCNYELPCPRLGTCGEADLHCPLPMPKHLKLGQRHLVGHPDRVGALVPLIPNIPHGVTDCNHKPVPAAVRQTHRSRFKPKKRGNKKKRKKKGMYTVRFTSDNEQSLVHGYVNGASLYMLTNGTVLVVVTCGKINTSRRLPVAQHPKLR